MRQYQDKIMIKYDFSKAFIDKRTIETEFGLITFQNHIIGELVITSGYIVACDPFVFPKTDPFERTIPPGSYQVVLSVATIRDDQRVAYAKVQVTDKPTLKWEMALLPDQQESSLKENEIFGYGVDAGTGCFMDKEAAEILIQRLRDCKYSDFLIDEMEKNYMSTWDWANICLHPNTGLNMISFKSGWGDGVYASYFGYDEDGNITSLVTDFSIVEDTDVFQIITSRSDMEDLT